MDLLQKELVHTSQHQKTITATKDNKIIILLSTYAGVEPKTTIQRFD